MTLTFLRSLLLINLFVKLFFWDHLTMAHARGRDSYYIDLCTQTVQEPIKCWELGSLCAVCLCYRLFSRPSRDLTAFKEWSPPLCPALTGAGNTPRRAYFCFCRHVRPRGIHPSMKGWMFFFLLSHHFLSLLPLPFSLNPNSWIKWERHTPLQWQSCQTALSRGVRCYAQAGGTKG